ncbi:MAG: prepilin-type N-terminal cleavage/methylation domain-containing protein [Phycisphaerales bacterium]|jgi:prepilin-type N-terminal cleavage/methylation domain-containing protein|nr:prepilin-type N-terminal cleavage/methylation domain-containing protein [Phycisphaerales bacterium]
MTRTIDKQNRVVSYRKRSGRQAFTLTEVILATSIMAILMVAGATAVKVSLDGFSENDKVTRAMQSARSTIERLSRQLRTADNVSFTQSSEPGTYNGQSVTMDVTTLVITNPRDGSGLQQVQYIHRTPMGSDSLGKLYYNYQETGQGLTTPTMAMLGEDDDVQINAFSVTTVADGASVVRAKVQFTLNVGGREFDFASGVAMRGYEYQ